MRLSVISPACHPILIAQSGLEGDQKVSKWYIRKTPTGDGSRLAVGVAVAAVLSSSAALAAAPVDDWYFIQNPTLGLACVSDDAVTPLRSIQTARNLGHQYVMHDVHDGPTGQIVQTTFDDLTDGTSVTFYRGCAICKAALAELLTKEQAEADRYGGRDQSARQSDRGEAAQCIVRKGPLL